MDALNGNKHHVKCIISCGSRKLTAPALAREMYTSYLFRTSFRIAQSIDHQPRIISAKYGLLKEDDVILPYDQNLRDLSGSGLSEWQEAVEQDLLHWRPEVQDILVFGGERYLQEIRRLAPHGSNVTSAFDRLPLGARTSALKRFATILDRNFYAKRLYERIEEYSVEGRLKPLQELKHTKLPRRGIYIFLDPEERTRFSTSVPRIVRIGTHAVSQGSSSTIRTRLRAHFGLGDGGGSHRSSIFRLHVGNALLSSTSRRPSFPSWGIGQSAGADVRRSEAEIENEVSKYLRRLLLLVIEVDDEPSSLSLRAFLERNLIAILAGEGGPIEPPSDRWLGNHSTSSSVKASGLWNIQHVGSSTAEAKMALTIKLLIKESDILL